MLTSSIQQINTLFYILSNKTYIILSYYLNLIHLVYLVGCFHEGCYQNKAAPEEDAFSKQTFHPTLKVYSKLTFVDAIRAIYGAHWRAAHNNALRAFIFSLRHSLEELPEGKMRQFYRVPRVASLVSSVRTQTVPESYSAAPLPGAEQPHAAPKPGGAQPTSAAQSPAAPMPGWAQPPTAPMPGAALPPSLDPLPMDEDEEQELQPEDKVYKL